VPGSFRAAAVGHGSLRRPDPTGAVRGL